MLLDGEKTYYTAKIAFELSRACSSSDREKAQKFLDHGVKALEEMFGADSALLSDYFTAKVEFLLS